MKEDKVGFMLLFSLGLLSAAIIAFQLVLMQLLSITQWYHFAFMIISVALLGFGAAGTILALFRKKLLQKKEKYTPILMLLCGLFMAIVPALSQLSFFRFDSYLLFAQQSHFGRLIGTYLLFFFPFLFGALAIGIIFTIEVKHIGKIYFANLLGSGLGGLSVLLLMPYFAPEKIPALIAIFPVIAGFLTVKKQKKWPLFIGSLSLAGTIIFFFYPPTLHLSEYKSLQKTLSLPETKVEETKYSPQGLVQVVSSPALRFGPGLSLKAPFAPKIGKAIFINGDWYGPYVDFGNEEFASVLQHTTMALPYVMGERKKILILNARTGFQVPQAIQNGASEIHLVEPNHLIIDKLEEQLPLATSHIQLKNVNARNYITSTNLQYQLIQIPMIGAFGGTSGLHATQEQFLLTLEGFQEMYEHLSDNGVISISCWLDYPPRNALKSLALISQMLEDNGISKLSSHIAAIRSWGTVTFAVTKKPLDQKTIQKIRDFCDQKLFDPLVLPGIREEERTRFNQLQDSTILHHVDQLLSDNKNQLLKDYSFDIKPPTDNSPYFSQFLQWKSLGHLADLFGGRSIPFFEIGFLLVIVTLAQICILSLLLIILPLFQLKTRKGQRLWSFFYFSGIGLGYMFLEMVLIQRLTLYFGDPIYAASTSISAILIFSGIGSYLAEKWNFSRKILLVSIAIILLLILAYTFWLSQVLLITISLNPALKIIFAAFLIAPLAIFMGFPFPSGLSFLGKTNPSLIPWAWGINSCFSVISTALATLVAIEWGFRWVMLVAGVGYLVTWTASYFWENGRKKEK
ncbi:hypothetical protein QWY93_10825 [Echinicola jeungdonensis]|uniref:Spermidine synthase n=1 Tax=Echinicola jeungdonensis TaxID=709343 RepID=A0ABV5J6B6_9BACT|nr:hypothetical protein [Echinicola jeungdonensis]MDN3669817.1 hypothetical protein [Echinicola jeungdonensis]